MTKEIPLTQDKTAFVDDEDYERVSQYKWWAQKDRDTNFYAKGWVNGRKVSLHCFIMDVPEELEVDHKDRDGLNCTRENLRPATHAQNMYNQDTPRHNTSGYKGVSRLNGKWRAAIHIHGEQKHLGCFDDPIEAARAYDAAAREYFGEFAQTNFAV